MSLFAFQDIVTSITGIILLVAMAMAIQVAQAPAREKAGIDATEYGILTERLAEIRQLIDAKQTEVSELTATLEQTAAIGPSGSGSDLEKIRAENARLAAQIASEREELAVREARGAEAQAELDSINEAMNSDETSSQAARAKAKLARLRQSNRILFNRPPEGRGRLMVAELFRDRVLIATAGVSERPFVYTGSDYADKAIEQADRSPRRTTWVLFAHPGSTEALNRLRKKLRSRGQATGFDLLPDSLTVLDPETGTE